MALPAFFTAGHLPNKSCAPSTTCKWRIFRRPQQAVCIKCRLRVVQTRSIYRSAHVGIASPAKKAKAMAKFLSEHTPVMSTPDIEIYLQDTPASSVFLWLAARFPDADGKAPKPAGKKQWRLQLKHGEHLIPALVIEEASPGFTSVWFDSSN